MTETNSWYTIKNGRSIKGDVINTDKKVTRAEQIYLYPNRKQIILFNASFKGYNTVYNLAVDFINSGKHKEKLISKNHFKTYVSQNIRDKIDPFFDKHHLNKKLIPNAIRDAHKAYVSCQANLKAGNINHFKLKHKTHDKKSILLSEENFSETQNGFNITVFGKMKTSKSIMGISTECRVVLKNNKYILFKPVQRVVKTVSEREPICGSDPGGRKFQTVYDTKISTKIAQGSYKMYTRLSGDILKINNQNHLWSRNKTRLVKLFIKLTYLRKIDDDQITVYDNLIVNYPLEWQRIYKKMEKKKFKPKLNKKSEPSKKSKTSQKTKSTDTIQTDVSKSKKRKRFHRPPKNKTRRRKYHRVRHSRHLAIGVRLTRMDKLDAAKNEFNKLVNKEYERLEKLITDNAKITLPRKAYYVKKDKLRMEILNYQTKRYNPRINPKVKLTKHTRSLEAKLKKKNKRLRARCKNLTEDMHWKVANYLVKNYDEIALGNMSTQSIISKDRDLPKSVKKHMVDLSHYKFQQRLKSKAEEYSCQVHITNEYMTSKTCSNCHGVDGDLGSAKIYNCNHCGMIKDRDRNGATNILDVHRGVFPFNCPEKYKRKPGKKSKTTKTTKN